MDERIRDNGFTISQASIIRTLSDDEIVEMFKKVHDAAAKESTEQCCKDVCSYCRDGDVPERRMYSHPPKPFWVHTMIGFDDRIEDCTAGAIHERLGKSAIRSRVAAQGGKMKCEVYVCTSQFEASRFGVAKFNSVFPRWRLLKAFITGRLQAGELHNRQLNLKLICDNGAAQPVKGERE